MKGTLAYGPYLLRPCRLYNFTRWRSLSSTVVVRHHYLLRKVLHVVAGKLLGDKVWSLVAPRAAPTQRRWGGTPPGQRAAPLVGI